VSFSKRHGYGRQAPEICIREDAPEQFRAAAFYAARKADLRPSEMRDAVCEVLHRRPDAENWSDWNISASCSPHDDDGAWPHPAVRDVIENAESTELERAFELGVYNGRGVVTRAWNEGGAQETALADRYQSFARTIADRSPRTATLLRRIADGYRAEARRRDEEAELREDRER